jgi:hypothetical protein
MLAFFVQKKSNNIFLLFLQKYHSFENKSQKHTSHKMGCRSNFALIVSCVLLVAAFVLIVGGIIEIHKSRTYIKNDCQVIASDTVEFICNDNGSDCRYKPVWTVLYDRPNDNDEPIKAEIDPSYLDTKSEAEAIKKQMEYEVISAVHCQLLSI